MLLPGCFSVREWRFVIYMYISNTFVFYYSLYHFQDETAIREVYEETGVKSGKI